jgi:hypothetical protein
VIEIRKGLIANWREDQKVDEELSEGLAGAETMKRDAHCVRQRAGWLQEKRGRGNERWRMEPGMAFLYLR